MLRGLTYNFEENCKTSPTDMIFTESIYIVITIRRVPVLLKSVLSIV